MFDHIDFIGAVQVNKEMVDAFKAKINYRLKEHKYVHISDEFNDLYNYKIGCSSDRKDEEVKKLTKKLSSFMAYQEALHSLML